MDARKLQDQETSDLSDSSNRSRSCLVCKVVLPTSWTKASCQGCITKLINEENTASCKEFMTTMRHEMVETFRAFRENLPTGSAPVVPPVAVIPKENPKPRKALVKTTRRLISSDEEEEEEIQDVLPGGQVNRDLSQDDMSDQSDTDEKLMFSRFRFPVEETDELVRAIHTTLNINQTTPAPVSIHDKLYSGMDPTPHLNFPVHPSTKNLINTQWKYPEKKLFISRGFRKRFPFSEEDAKLWEGCPKLDAAFSLMNRENELAFEDLGFLKDPADKKIDLSLKKAYTAAVTNFKPAAATTCVSRTTLLWIERVEELVKTDAPKKDILEALSVVKKSNNYVTDASTESLRVTAKTTALVNNARRNLWLKTWDGSQSSKSKACNLPFTGDLLFGPQLQEVLEKTASRKLSFPKKKKFKPNRPFFRRNNQARDKGVQKRRTWPINKEGPRRTPLHKPAEPQSKHQ
ncbi:uncharacterized protein [Hyperolius riggenbachi]|uniref:uncharacterized protein n=1 Tax=Hyperolius riggenbachi TaxID=752182 RepID=UPI0035A2F961